MGEGSRPPMSEKDLHKYFPPEGKKGESSVPNASSTATEGANKEISIPTSQVPDIERGPEPETRLSPETISLLPASIVITKEAETTETYDKAFWTPDRIKTSIVNFFEKMNRNDKRLRAMRERLLQQAVKEEEARRIANKAIAERELAEMEAKRRERIRNEYQESEAERQFRHTIEWMVEQSHDVIRDTALNFLTGASQHPTQTLED